MEKYQLNALTSSKQLLYPPGLDLASILLDFEVSGTHFFLTRNPISLYMCYQGTNELVGISFTQPIKTVSDFSYHLAFPSLFIFGGRDSAGKASNSFVEVNLLTFEWSNLSKEETYCPEARCSHMAYLKDDRLYVWGGLRTDGSPVQDKLLWTFDFEKSYWFALEMSSPVAMDAQSFKVSEREDNKLTVLDVRDCAVYGVDMYQSAIRQEKCSRKMGILDESSKFINKMTPAGEGNHEGIVLSNSLIYKLLVFSRYEAMMEYQMKNHMSDC